MSYFSIEDFIESGEKSLKDKNYWSALSVALALPSICSRVMYQGDKYKGSDRNDIMDRSKKIKHPFLLD